MREFISQPWAANLDLVVSGGWRGAGRGTWTCGFRGGAARRRRRPVAERRVRPPRVVLDPPPFDHDLGLLQRIENLSVQALVPQLPIETLAVPVLPGTPRFDVQRSGSQIPEPLP